MRRAFNPYIIIILSAVLFFGRCDTVYEYPDENETDPTAIDFSFTVDVNFDMEFNFENVITRIATAKESSATGHKGRVIIEVYPDKYPGTELIDPEIYNSAPYIRTEMDMEEIRSGQQAIDLQLKLSPQPYIFLVWADYQEKDNPGNLHYKADKLYNIGFTDTYVANTDTKDAFCASKRIDLSPYKGQWNVHIKEHFTLHRPLARYEFITTDIDTYFGQRAKNSKTTPTPSDLSRYTAKVKYKGFYPSEYDVIIDRPSDAKTGMTYQAQFSKITDRTAVIAFDYVFTNDSESAVTIDLEIYDSEGNLLRRNENIRVPYKRNSITKIHGNFMTTNYGTGTVIDPSYNGEYDIYL